MNHQSSNTKRKLSFKLTKEEANELMWDSIRVLRESGIGSQLLIAICLGTVAGAVIALLL